MRKIVVAASSLPAGRNMSSQLDYVVKVGSFGADMYHIDVMDGVYVRAKTLDYTYIEQLRGKSALLFDVHLMVAHPEKVIDKYLRTSADIVTLHLEVFENSEDLISILKKIKKRGKMAGIAIDLDTDIKKVQPFLEYVDIVLIMAVKAGKGGQAFDINTIKKIKYVRGLSETILIEVDGGINDVTGAKCIRAGADILVSGNYIYSNDTYTAIQSLKGKNG